MPAWQEQLFIWLASTAADATEYLRRPRRRSRNAGIDLELCNPYPCRGHGGVTCTSNSSNEKWLRKRKERRLTGIQRPIGCAISREDRRAASLRLACGPPYFICVVARGVEPGARQAAKWPAHSPPANAKWMQRPEPRGLACQSSWYCAMASTGEPLTCGDSGTVTLKRWRVAAAAPSRK